MFGHGGKRRGAAQPGKFCMLFRREEPRSPAKEEWIYDLTGEEVDLTLRGGDGKMKTKRGDRGDVRPCYGPLFPARVRKRGP